MADTNGTNGHTASPPAPLHLMAALQSRAALAARLGLMFGGRRNMHELLGYKADLGYADFKARYLRQHLAHRLVRVYPEATWAQPPSVEEDNTNDIDTPFEAAWSALVTRLNVFAALERIDVLANLGRYSVLLIGLRGQPALDQPARPVRGPEDVLYLTPYSEEFASVERLEGNPGVETFGKPLLYRFDFSRGNDATKRPLPVGQGLVHASRVLHVAEDILDDEVYGTPRLEPIFDLLDDLFKVVGGSSEIFYVDAKKRLVFAMRDDYRLDPADEAALTAEIEEYVHELRSFIRVQGIDVKALESTVASPKDHVEVIMALIAATTGIPKRVLEGSERGELASTQDADAWLQRISRRQRQFGEQRMLRPLVDRLVALKALPLPAQPYQVSWDNLMSLSEDQQATIAQKVATALNQYASGLANTIVPESEFRSIYLGLSEVPDVEPLDVAPGPEEL
jgi:hypothetical protein